MSRHQLIRNMDYQEALQEALEEASSEEEDEISPEDRILLNEGTANVRAALGVEASKVTVAQIEEALWHYYYDVDKTVAYLTSKFINPAPKATTPKATKPAPQQSNGKSVTHAIGSPPAGLSPELDMSANWARKSTDTTDAARSVRPSYPAGPVAWRLPLEYRPSCSRFFKDMPWGNIPKHREAIFIPPLTPRGGLLGGSGAPPKMSKLQALAAARKKKAEEKHAINDKMEQTRMGVDELSVQDPLAEKQNLPATGPFSKRLKTSESTAQGRPLPAVAADSTQPEPATAAPSPPTAAEKAPEDALPLAKAQPSAFAQTLFGSPSNPRKSQAPKPLVVDSGVDFPFCVGQAPKPTATSLELGPAFELHKRKRDDSDQYETTVVLYPNLPQFVRDNFAQPSPDDIVLAAQAKAKGKGSHVKVSTR